MSVGDGAERRLHVCERFATMPHMATRLSDPERELRRLRDDAGYRDWQELADTMREDGIEISRSTVWRYCVNPGPQLLARNVDAIAGYLKTEPARLRDLMEQLHGVRVAASSGLRSRMGGHIREYVSRHLGLRRHTPWPPFGSVIRGMDLVRVRAPGRNVPTGWAIALG